MKTPFRLISIFSMSIVLSSAYSAPSDADRTQNLLKKVVQKYKAMKTFTSRFTVDLQVKGFPALKYSGTVKAQKPNLFWVDSQGVLDARMTCDGKSVLYWLKPQNAYSLMPYDDMSLNQTVTAVAPFTLFFNPAKLVAPNTPTTYKGKQKAYGATCDVVEQKVGSTTMVYFISPDHIVLGMKVHAEFGGQVQDVEATLSNVKIDSPLSVKDFPTEPPAKGIPFELTRIGGKRIEVGQTAPGLTVSTPSGGTLSLDQVLKEKKVVLVTFWFYACATCRREFPRLLKVYEDYKAKGLEIVAIDSNDDRTSVMKYVREAKLTFPVGLDDDGTKHFGVVKAYGVGMFPTSYLLDSSGKVLACFTSFDEAALRKAIEAGVRE